jgi:uncharacterized protein involved in exopolysaccharide biosynthesis
VRFEIVQPPNAAFAPVFPKRSLFLAGAFVLALLVGGGLAYLLHLMRPVVGSARSLAEFTGLPVLGVVSSAFPGRLHANAKRDLLHFAAAAACLFAGFVVAIFLNWSGFRLLSASNGVG